MTLKKIETKMVVKGISVEDFWRIGLGDCPTIHIEGAHELFQRVIQQIRLRGLANIFTETRSYVFENKNLLF